MAQAKRKSVATTLARIALPALMVPSLAFASTSYDRSSYERADVVGVDPIYESVSYDVPVQECRQEQVRYDQPVRTRASVTGPILGAIIGGAIGNAVGHNKRNKQVGTVVGAVLGGSIGADIGRRQHRYPADRVSYRTEQVCEVVQEVRTEEQFAGYNVSYAYGGKTYTTRMQRDPGRSIRVRVRVSPVD
jgi:uncharacterized protein YcfJ